MFFKRRIRLRFIGILLVIVGVPAYFAFYYPTSSAPKFVSVQNGEIILREQGEALVIRRESIYEFPEHGVTRLLTAEGEIVEHGDKLAILYTNGYDERLVSMLNKVQDKIYAYQKENIVDYVLNLDMEAVQSDITEAIMQIQLSLRDDDLDDLESKEQNLRDLLNKRQEILDKSINPDHYLKDLYDKEAELNRNLRESRLEVTAQGYGIISFSSDGLEKVLNAEAIAHLTLDNVAQFLEQERASQTMETTTRLPFVRLIDPSRWFLACILPYTDVLFVEGEEVELRFLDDYERPLNGRIIKVSEGSNALLVVTEFDLHSERVINIRNANVELARKAIGLMVPQEALIEKEGIKGMYIVHGDSTIFAEVKLKAIGDKYAIIEDVEDEIIIRVDAQVLIN